MIRTALVKVAKNEHKIFRYDDYATQKEFAADLRGNGYRVLKIWNGYKTDEQVAEWHCLNRSK